MTIRSPQQLRKRLRQNALDCDELAGKQLRPANRTRMLRTAEQYRILADNIDRLRWGPLIKSLEIARASWLKCTPHPNAANGTALLGARQYD